MNAMPDFIRLLEGDELARAEDVYNAIVPALEMHDGHRGAHLAATTRIVYEGGGFEAIDASHVRALGDAARAIGEDRLLVCDTVAAPTITSKWRVSIAALEADPFKLADFIASSDWRSVRNAAGEWERPETKGWPKAAAEIANPVFTDDWAILSAKGTWGWVDSLEMEDCKLTGPEQFMKAYKAARPEVVIDPIAYLHSDGYLLIGDWERQPRTGRLGRFLPKKRVYVEEFGVYAREYFEPMYGEQASARIWEIYKATSDGVSRLEGYESWDAKVAHFTQVIDNDPQMGSDLEAIWDGTYVRR